MQRVIRAVGYVLLLATATGLLGGVLVEPTDVSFARVGFTGSLVVAGAVTAAVERRATFDSLAATPLEPSDAADAFAVVGAAGLTYVLSVHASFGPVLASALVGVAAGVGTPDVDTAAYCGSFVGMASPTVFPSVGLVFAAGLVSGAAFVAARESFVGFGGKLGTLALFGCSTTGLLLGIDYASTAGVQWGSAAITVPVAAVAAVTTAALSVRCGLGAVVGSALVGLVAGFTLPVVAPDVGGLLATVAFCASFVGMSTRERLGSEARVGVAGGLCGLVFILVAPAFAGAGGKLGTTAFISCLALAGTDRLVTRVGDRFGMSG
ncbi:hypothetical protein [Halobacterium jilantaiense]|uniref:Uncharacterized protein n=1 Tax=Halobacterium jilantaiense TaxID=355548 RepID=A0A1I0P8E6_9EURY|nr:hypothetical protein [Halobacterium jilantaiense]SEW10673.1 hypothetical protein SAMN04487945_1489 [Halobacterium jilantaiense]